mmetsp:Transcript_35039/g.69155  ORF Transcript_35039/g.69155 Transcript_35039/m.69155 type:complete len:133 (-) Transcript_35039:160-558(-)
MGRYIVDRQTGTLTGILSPSLCVPFLKKNSSRFLLIPSAVCRRRRRRSSSVLFCSCQNADEDRGAERPTAPRTRGHKYRERETRSLKKKRESEKREKRRLDGEKRWHFYVDKETITYKEKGTEATEKEDAQA